MLFPRLSIQRLPPICTYLWKVPKRRHHDIAWAWMLLAWVPSDFVPTTAPAFSAHYPYPSTYSMPLHDFPRRKDFDFVVGELIFQRMKQRKNCGGYQRRKCFRKWRGTVTVGDFSRGRFNNAEIYATHNKTPSRRLGQFCVHAGANT